MSSGERPMGAAKGKQSDTEALGGGGGQNGKGRHPLLAGRHGT